MGRCCCNLESTLGLFKCCDIHPKMTPRAVCLDKWKFTASTSVSSCSVRNFIVHRTVFGICFKPQRVSIVVRQGLKTEISGGEFKKFRVGFFGRNQCNSSYWFVGWGKELSSVWTSSDSQQWLEPTKKIYSMWNFLNHRISYSG